MPFELPWIGNQLTLYPPTQSDGSLNIVSGTRAINSKLLHILLMRQGEDPLHPDLGYAPELFTPKSAESPQYFRYNLKQLISRWNEVYKLGIQSFEVEIIDRPQTNSIEIAIVYIPLLATQKQMMSFGYWEYLDALQGISLSDYLNTIRFAQIDR